jgi:signal transduction histidine kinase
VRKKNGPSLLWKILLSISVAVTLLVAVAGWFVESETRATLSASLEGQLQGSFHAYESLWRARTEMLRSVSLVLSSMSDVRAAFRTNDGATIRDTAGEIWSRISQSAALFLVTDPRGDIIASLGGGELEGTKLAVVEQAARHFPKQTAGFTLVGGELFEVVVTPVYVQTQSDSGLLNVLVAGFPVDATVANDLKQETGGSDFVFLAGGKPLAGTVPAEQSTLIANQYRRGGQVQQIRAGNDDVAVLGSALLDLEGRPAGDLLIVHSYAAVKHSLESLDRKLLLIWAGALVGSLVISLILARRIIKPIRQLDQAAALIARQEYATRVPEGGNDELGRLAHTFNAMGQSIQDARSELIRQERMLTIGRLSSSIAHDLRNPLAAIYGGAEMMMDGNLTEAQMHRVAGNIYRSSRVINDLLQELLDVSRGRMQSPELCNLSEVVSAACEAESAAAEQQGVHLSASVEPSIELPLERARMERVFLNLITNAIEAMPNGGTLRIAAERNGTGVIVKVDDTGPGIPASVRQRIFEPFVTSRKNGLGLGLALSRQTVIEHGGELWIEDNDSQGAHFRLRLPL